MKIVYLRNKPIVGSGLDLMNIYQANYFYDLGCDVSILIDSAYDERIFNKSIYKQLRKGIEVIPFLDSCSIMGNRCAEEGITKRRHEKDSFFGGKVTKYYDKFGKMVKTSYHDSTGQRVKIKLPIVEKYINELKKGDIVMAMEASLSWYLANLKMPDGVIKIVQIHNQHFYLQEWIDPCEKIDALLVQTKKTKLVYEEKYGKKNNIEIIPGFLTENISTGTVKKHIDRPYKIVVVGRLEEGKQPLDAIKAFEIIQKEIPSATLEFYGTGKLEDELKEYINVNAISNVIFHGYCEYKSKIFSDASLMLFPTNRESLGLVIIEAFAYGVPTVAYSTLFGVDDLIDSGENGYIVPQGNIDDLAKKAIELLNNPEERDRMAEKGIYSVQQYSQARVMGNFWNLLQNIVAIKDKKLLLLNKIKRLNPPEQLMNHLYEHNGLSYSDLTDIYDELKSAKSVILKGKAYVYNKKLYDNIPKSLCIIE